MKRLKAGILGLGSWGECHLEACMSLPHIEVSAICDLREDRVRYLGDRYSIQGQYTDEDDLITREDLDLIIVVTFEKEHLRPTLKALQAGKHVLVEKPVTTSIEEAEMMQKAAEAAGRHVIPGHLLRFEPKYAETHRAILDGRIGPPLSMYFKRSRQHSLFATYQRTHTVYELMIHDLDLALWYAGSRVSKVRAYGLSPSGAATPEILWACLQFETGALAMLQSNWMTPDEAGIVIHDSAEIIGTNGLARFDTEPAGLQVLSSSGRITTDFSVHHRLNGQAAGALRDQLDYVARCLITGNPPDRISFTDAVQGVKVADAIVRSASTGQEIELLS
ncbi:hypothetical protein SD71_13340 [Cohnella kolymensis]|uniref:Gfo/Idh/MocA-like oxidoreductase N-terminal domain-containing protein n=1 Tax=Cohnella kolymensis TaxID=1590652 RepID=A0ABR5A348_9BACL|nr:Gfo/Idh/MocA family oxidoreductase [Cohnella kolymensis]KIL35492.1 hypothetical protein SD71_13340 [Cohnella kolymensis]